MNPAEMTELAKAIVSAMPRIPIEVDVWSAEEVGQYLKVGKRQVLERYAPLPGFPKAIRLPTPDGTRGQPRWEAMEVIEWARKWKK